MDTIDSLRKISAEAQVPSEFKERTQAALDHLPVHRNWDSHRPPHSAISPEETADILLNLYRLSPTAPAPESMKVVFNDQGQDFNFSLSREIGRLLPDLMHEFAESKSGQRLRNFVAPQVVANARTYLVNRTDIGEVFAATAAKNIWSALLLLAACLQKGWIAGLETILPLIEMMSRAIPVYYCRQQTTWLVQRLV